MSYNKKNGKLDFRNVKMTQFDSSQTNRMEFSELQSAKRTLPTNTILKDAYTHFRQTLDGDNRPTKVDYYQALDSTIDKLTFRADSGGDLAGTYYILTNNLDGKTYAIYQVVSGSGSAPGVADVEIAATYNNNDSATLVAFANKQALANITDIRITYSGILSDFVEIEYLQFGDTPVIDLGTTGFTVSRTKEGESYLVTSVELEYDSDGNIIWQEELLKNAVYDPYTASFNFPTKAAITDENGNPYGPDNPLSVQLSDGSVNIGTVNAELEVQLSHLDNDPDAGDIHDSVRIGDGVEELAINTDSEALVHDQDTHDKLDILNTSVNDQSDETQTILQAEFDETQVAIINNTNTLENTLEQIDDNLDAEFQTTRDLLQSEFDETQVNQDEQLAETQGFRSDMNNQHDETQNKLDQLITNFTDVVDFNNTTTTPLGAGATFTGIGTDILGYAQININYYADQDADADGIEFQFSHNNVDWFKGTPEYNYQTGQYRTFQLGIYGRYFRVVYTNGVTAQSEISIETLLLTKISHVSVHRVDSSITDDRSVQVVKSINTARQPDGDYINAKADGIAVDIDNNSIKTSSPLGVSGIYESGWIDSDGYKSIEISIQSDVASDIDGIVVEFTDDANATTPTVISTQTFTFSVKDVEAGQLTLYLPPRLDGYRIRYINGIAAQTTFELESTLRTASVQPISLPIASPIVDSTNAEVIRTVLAGNKVDSNLEPTEFYGNAEVTSNNSLKTQSVHEVIFKYATPDDPSLPSGVGITVDPVLNPEPNVIDSGWIAVREFKTQDFHILSNQSVKVFLLNASDSLGNNIQGGNEPNLVTISDSPASVAARFFDDYFRVIICNESGSSVTEITARSTGGNGTIQPVDISIDQPVFGFFPAPLTQNVSKGKNPDDVYEALRIQGQHSPNTTSTLLNGNTGGTDHIFTGEWFEWEKNYIKLSLALKSDQSGTVYVDFSQEDSPTNGDNSSVDSSIMVSYSTPNQLFRRQYPLQSKWVRVRYENGLAAQSTFNLTSSFLITDPGLVTQEVQVIPENNNLAGLNRSIQTIRNASGTGFQDVPVRTDTGNPKHSIEEIHDDVLLKPLTQPKFTQVSVGNTPVRLDTSPLSDRRATIIKNSGSFSCAVGTSNTITYNSESYRLPPESHVVLPFSEDVEYWGVAQDTGGTQTLLTRSGASTSGTVTTPNNALTSNGSRAIMDATGETLEVSGFTAGTTNDILSVTLGAEMRKEAGQFETAAWVDTVGQDVGNVGSITSPTVTANEDHLYIVSVSTNEPGTTVTGISNTMGFDEYTIADIGDILVGDSNTAGGDSAESRTHMFRMTGTPTSNGTITVTFSETAGHAVIAVTRISGADLADPIDSIDVDNDNNQTNYSGTLTSATNGGLYIGAFGSEIETHQTATTPTGAIERFQDGSTTNNNQTQAIVTASITSTGSLGYSGSYSGGNDISYVVAAIKPSEANNPIVNLNYELSAIAGTTSQSYELTNTSDTNYELDISSDRAWVFSDIANITVILDGSSISAAAAEIDYVYIEIIDSTGNVTIVCLIQGGEELL